MRRWVLALGMVGAAGCSTPGASPWVSAGGTGADFQEGAVMAIISQALEGDASDEDTDSLYVRERVVVADGWNRSVPPLFAGVGRGGEVVITSSQVEIRAASAWSVVEYRWISGDGKAREGRATLVLSQVANRTWRIQHVHSSSPDSARSTDY